MRSSTSKKPRPRAAGLLGLLTLSIPVIALGQEPDPAQVPEILRELDALPSHLMLTTAWPDEALPGAPDGPSGFLASRTPSVPPLPANEVVLNAGIALFNPSDYVVKSLRRHDGRVCLLHLEGFRLRALVSLDEGRTFVSEVDIAGMPLSADVRNYDAVLSGDGLLHVVMAVADAEGGLGLQYLKSPDMGLSWSAPHTLVDPGSPAHGLDGLKIPRKLVVRANSLGLVAVAFVSRDDQGVRVVTSGDGGESWAQAVLLNDPAPGPGFGLFEIALAVSGDGGSVTVAYSNNRPFPAEVLVSRSSDGGATFGPPSNVVQSIPWFVASEGTELVHAVDGSLMLALHGFHLDPVYWAQSSSILVFRSTAVGEPFHLIAMEPLDDVGGSIAYTIYPTLAVDPNASTVLLGYRDPNRRMQLHRSGDHGASFGPAQDLTGATIPRSVVRPVIQRTMNGGWAVAFSAFGPGPEFEDVVSVRVIDDNLSLIREADLPSVYSGLLEPYSTVPVAPDHLLVAFAGHDETGEADVQLSIGAVADLVFPPRTRIDSDTTTVEAPASTEVNVVTDGAQRVYAVFKAMDGPLSPQKVFLKTSMDRGLTFSPAQDVGPEPLENQGDPLPWIRATQDGRVYLAVMRVRGYPDYGADVLLNRSSDFGTTWSGFSTVLSVTGYVDRDSLSLAAAPGGKVFVGLARLTPPNVVIGRSADGGANFETTQISPTGIGQLQGSVLLCLAGDRLFVGWGNLASVEVTHSDDDGETFASSSILAEGWWDFSESNLACHPTGRAVMAWVDDSPGYGREEIRASRYEDGSWQPVVTVVGPDDSPGEQPRIAFVSGSGHGVVIVSRFRTWDEQGVLASKSSDGGQTFDTTRLDDPGEAGRWARRPRVVSDGSGNVWASWLDLSASTEASLLVRRSTDGGETWDPARRADRKDPAGAYLNVYFDSTDTAALSGIGFFAWAGERNGFRLDALLNTDDLFDADRDGSLTGADCDDQDPSVSPGAVQACDGVNNDCDDPEWPVVPEDETDPDLDDFLSCADNCPSVYNPDQADSDSDGQGDACPNVPPVAAAGHDAEYECGSPAGAWVVLDGSGSADADSTPGTNDDIVLFEWFEGFGLPEQELLGLGEVLELELSLGVHAITLRVTDSFGDTDTDELELTVVDTTPPEILVSVQPTLLCPPNHRMVDIRATVSANDLCGQPEFVLRSVLSSEPDDAAGLGDGQTVGDIQGADIGSADLSFQLRAERAGNGNGRTYAIRYDAIDLSGHETSSTAIVLVPHDMAGVPAIAGAAQGNGQPFELSSLSAAEANRKEPSLPDGNEATEHSGHRRLNRTDRGAASRVPSRKR